MVWMRSRSYDAVFMMGGLWTMALVVALNGTGLLKSIQFGLAVLFWVGHRLTTTYIAYCQEAYREHLTKQRVRFLYVPGAVLALVFIMVMVPESVLPVPVLHRLLALAALDFAWEFYHFTMQHYGVVSIYRMRAGQDPGAVADKRWEKIFCYAVFGGGIPLATLYHAFKGMAASNPDFFMPGWGIQGMRMLGIAVALGFTARAVVVEARNPKMSLPKLLYMVSVGLPVSLAFVYDSMAPALLILAVQHWMVSVGLTSHMAAGRAPVKTEPNGWYRFWNVFNRSPWAVMVIMCIGSAALAPVMEFSDVERRYVMRAVRAAFDPASAERHYVYWGAQYLDLLAFMGRNTVVSLFIATGFAFGYIHYLMDRAVYRFSDPDTRRQSAPLIFQKL